MNTLISVSNRKNLPKLFEFLSNNAHNVYATSGTYNALELYNKKDNLIAVGVSGIPNHSGFWYIRIFTTNKIPPPK